MEVVSVDFVRELRMTSQRHECIMAIHEKLTKSAHFIPVKRNFDAPDITQVFLKEIIRLCGVRQKIMSDRDADFTSKFLKGPLQSMGT